MLALDEATMEFPNMSDRIMRKTHTQFHDSSGLPWTSSHHITVFFIIWQIVSPGASAMTLPNSTLTDIFRETNCCTSRQIPEGLQCLSFHPIDLYCGM